MGDHHTYEESIKLVYRGLLLLAVVTLIEVFFSLFGKGHIFGFVKNEGFEWINYVVGFIIIVLSLYKAYFIIYDFMHMRYEVSGLAMSVLLPTGLLIWAIIAFMQEGNSWGERRQQIQDKNELPVKENLDQDADQQGMLDTDTYYIKELLG